MINLLNPKYIVPVIGEYRHQFALRNLCEQLGHDMNHVIMLDNGLVMQLQDGNLVPYKELIENGDFLVDGILENDVSDVVLRDRELLSQDGVLLVIANIDARQRKVVGEPEIVQVPASTIRPVGREGENVQITPDRGERAEDAVICP